jgi:hypothetical protein
MVRSTDPFISVETVGGITVHISFLGGWNDDIQFWPDLDGGYGRSAVYGGGWHFDMCRKCEAGRIVARGVGGAMNVSSGLELVRSGLYSFDLGLKRSDRKRQKPIL